VDGGTIPGMFDPDQYYLFRRNELEEEFDGWTILESRTQAFPALEDTRQDFSTVIAEKSSQKTDEFFQMT
jgi:hypothetical protein